MNGLLLVIQTISDFLWGTPMTIALIGTGLYLSIKFKFRYITKIKFHFRIHLERCSKEKVREKERYLDLQQPVRQWQTRSVLEILVVSQLPSQWEVRSDLLDVDLCTAWNVYKSM